MTISEEFQLHLHNHNIKSLSEVLKKASQIDKMTIAKMVANTIGNAVYAKNTQEALFIINEVAPLLNDSTCFDAETHPPLIFAVHHNLVEVMNALTPKLTRHQLEKETDMAGTALAYAIRHRKIAAIKAICKRGIQLALEYPHQHVIDDIATKIIRQIDGENVLLTENEHALAQKSILKDYYLAYFQSCSELNDFTVLRQLFFFAFRYLDNNNMRVGFFTNVFGNHSLSTEITLNATQMKTKISNIDSHHVNAMHQLLNCINETILIVRQLRIQHVRESPHGKDPEMSEIWNDSFNHKPPYKNGSFEKNIIAGLEAMNSKLIEYPIHATISKMINGISSYKPEAAGYHSKSYTS